MQCSFRAQKMADGSTRNFNTGNSVGCFYSHIGPSGSHFSSVIVYTMLVHAIFVQSSGIYNIINKET